MGLILRVSHIQVVRSSAISYIGTVGLLACLHTCEYSVLCSGARTVFPGLLSVADLFLRINTMQ